MLGPGIVIFATRVVLSFTNRKWSIMGWPEKPTFPVIRKAFVIPMPPLKCMPRSASTEVTPSRCSRKSKCQGAPELAVRGDRLEADLLLASDHRADLAVLDGPQVRVRNLAACLSRASLRGAVRRRLPTMSARYGGLLRCMERPSDRIIAAGRPGFFLPVTPRCCSRAVGSSIRARLELADDGAAVQDDRVVGDAQDSGRAARRRSPTCLRRG